MKVFSNKERSGSKVRTIQSEILIGILPLILVSMVLLSGLGYYASYKIIEANIGKEREKSLVAAVEIINKSLAENQKGCGRFGEIR
ncbi:MAG: hypothetical protein Q4D65_05285 [Peptostreptococcaceae bacterium]|nr:hypothetical protein [Peptostreptococcaceae bacterium]